jgi:hypothetical protein
LKKNILLGFAASLLAAGMAYAGPITYTETATATGSLNGVNFRDALVTLTMSGDTSSVFNDGGIWRNNGTASVTIAGLGSAIFTDTVDVFDNPGFPAAGFADFVVGSSILDTVNDAAFVTYDLTTAFGPITNANFINGGEHFGTNVGDFVIIAAGDSTFQATTAPEPMTVSFLGLGLGAMAVAKRIRQRRAA